METGINLTRTDFATLLALTSDPTYADLHSKLEYLSHGIGTISMANNDFSDSEDLYLVLLCEEE